MNRFLGVLTVIGIACSANSAERMNLTGQIFDENEAPYAGATVSIYTAKPRSGVAVLCPSCYMDCAKRERTDGKGEFTICSLDPSLLFRVLIVADRYEPQFLSDIDPAAGPIKAKLIPIDAERLKPGHVLRGRITGPVGQPIMGARIEVVGQHFEKSTQYGGLDGVDEIAASNDKGEFMITSAEPAGVYDISIEARGLAKKMINEIAAGDTVHDIKLAYGGTVRGVLMKNGAPVGGVQVGLAHANRASGSFLGDMIVATDEKGQFTFTNVPPEIDCFVYGLMDSLSSQGAVEARSVRAPKDAAQLDFGAIEVVPGNTFSGRVVLSDGKPVPEGTRVLFAREQAWDTLQVDVGGDGSFTAKGLPSEEYSITCGIRDYHVSPLNASLDPLNQNGLMGMISDDVAGIVLLMDPGAWDWKQTGPEASTRYTELKAKPIRGAKGK